MAFRFDSFSRNEGSSLLNGLSLKIVSAAAIAALYILSPQESIAFEIPSNSLHPVVDSNEIGNLVLVASEPSVEKVMQQIYENEYDDFSDIEPRMRVSGEVAELYRLRSQSMPLGQSQTPRKPGVEERPKEPVVQLTQELRKGCGGPQCIATLLRPSATLEFAFLFGLIAMGVVAQKREETSRRLKELVAAEAEQRRKSEEMMKGLQKQLQAQESLILDLLQGKSPAKDEGLAMKPENSPQSRERSRGRVRPQLLSEQVLSETVFKDDSQKRVQRPRNQREPFSHGDKQARDVVKRPQAQPNSTQRVEKEHSSKKAGLQEGKSWLHEQGQSSVAGKSTEGSHGAQPAQPLETKRKTSSPVNSSVPRLDSKPESAPHSIKAPSPRSKAPPRPRQANQSATSATKEHPKRSPTSWSPQHLVSTANQGQVAPSPLTTKLVVVPDTNCYLRRMRFVKLLRKLPSCSTVVPLAVLGELDGLQHNKDPKTAFYARKAVRFFAEELEQRGSWLKGQKKTEVPKTKSTDANEHKQQADHTEVPGPPPAGNSSEWRAQWKLTSGGQTADNSIIDCCLYFMEEGYSVVLLTDDKALQVNAMFHELPTSTLRQFLEKSLTATEIHHLK